MKVKSASEKEVRYNRFVDNDNKKGVSRIQNGTEKR